MLYVTPAGDVPCRDAQRAQLQSSSDKVAGLLAALQQSFTAASSKALGHQQAADSSDEEDGASQDTGAAGQGLSWAAHVMLGWQISNWGIVTSHAIIRP
jgi:hypothetical protein